MTILNSYRVTNISDVVLMMVVILIMSLVISFIISEGNGAIFLLSFILVAGLVSILVLPKCIRDTKHYQYEVLLEDNYSAKDLIEKYEIVEQRGDIWVVKDKE